MEPYKCLNSKFEVFRSVSYRTICHMPFRSGRWVPASLLKEAFKWKCLKLGKVELQSTYLNINIPPVFSLFSLSYKQMGQVFPNWVVVSDVSQIFGEPKPWRAGASTWLCPTEGDKPWSMLAWRKRYAMSLGGFWGLPPSPCFAASWVRDRRIETRPSCGEMAS